MLNPPVLILCAGFGKRMLNLTTNTPKPLLKVNNKTLLENTINFFQSIGCDNFFINTHYKFKKIENYITEKFYNENISLIYEPKILGTGGAVKNIFNYTKSKYVCVVNADIYWRNENKIDLINFLKDFKKIEYCKLFLSNEKNFFGLKKKEGDFNFQNNVVSQWIKGNNILYYSGCQIVSKNVFNKNIKIFSMNKIWDELIFQANLKGNLSNSNILHIGDKKSFEEL